MWDATVLSTVHLQERKPTEPHEYYIRTLPRQDGGENKRARFHLRESEGEEGKEGQRRDKEGPVRPNKDGLYSSEGQMGVLFMVSPYTLRGAPSGPFKAEEVYFLLSPGWSAHLGQALVPKCLHIPAHHTKELSELSFLYPYAT